MAPFTAAAGQGCTLLTTSLRNGRARCCLSPACLSEACLLHLWGPSRVCGSAAKLKSSDMHALLL